MQPLLHEDQLILGVSVLPVETGDRLATWLDERCRIIAPRITQGAVMSRRGVTSVRLLGWSSESA
jgi:hypothetical protein